MLLLSLSLRLRLSLSRAFVRLFASLATAPFAALALAFGRAVAVALLPLSSRHFARVAASLVCEAQRRVEESRQGRCRRSRLETTKTNTNTNIKKNEVNIEVIEKVELNKI